MRILYFSDNSSEHNRRFLEKISASGHEAWFLDASSDDLRAGWLPPGVGAVPHRQTVKRGSEPEAYEAFLPEFRSALEKVRPDVVHAGPIPGCAYVAALSGFHPVLASSWGSDLLLDAGRNRAWTRATTVALRAADGFMCDCDTVRRAAQAFAKIPDSRIAQFPWGIRNGSFSAAGPLPSETHFVSEPGAFRFICTRAWEPLYGIDVLIEAFRMAHHENNSLRLMLLGGGSMAGAVHSFVTQHGLDKVVLTPGPISAHELPRWFRAAHGYVSCARSDGTSVSLLEAMATGLPVLASDIPSNREWVSAEENGWLAVVGSGDSFAANMLRIASLNSAERAAISARNQKIVAERADWDKNFPQLLDLYECLVKVKAVAPA